MKKIINIELVLNIEGADLSIEQPRAYIVSYQDDEQIVSMNRRIQVAEKRYGILTLGAKTPVGRLLPRDQDITITFEGKQFLGHTHKTSIGRIDRLTPLIKFLRVTDEIEITYNTKENTMKIKKINKEVIS